MCQLFVEICNRDESLVDLLHMDGRSRSTVEKGVFRNVCVMGQNGGTWVKKGRVLPMIKYHFSSRACHFISFPKPCHADLPGQI